MQFLLKTYIDWYLLKKKNKDIADRLVAHFANKGIWISWVGNASPYLPVEYNKQLSVI